MTKKTNVVFNARPRIRGGQWLIVAVVLLSPRHLVTPSPVQPARGISQIHLSWSGDPKTTMTVMWQVSDANSTSHVEYGTSAQSLGQRAAAISRHYKYETGTIREAMITNLQADTTYHYRVVGNQPEGASTVSTFHTAPSTDVPFTFTAYGDQGVSVEARDTVKHVLGEKPAFHLHLGDLSYAGGKQSVWDEWLEQIEPLASRAPYMPTMGNHENEKIAGIPIGYVTYLTRFALPKPETRYVFDYAGARFVAFNSDDYTNAEQLQWFQEALKAAREDPKVRWLIVFQHHPLYSSTVKRENDLRRIAIEEKLLDEAKVDLLLGGHHHNYERSFPLRAGVITQQNTQQYSRGQGVVHVTSGGGGKGLYDFEPVRPPRTAVREKVHNYLRIKVSPGIIQCTALRPDGSTIDQFEIVNPSK